MAKRFINAPSDVVPELMQGLALDSSRVSLLEQPNGHHIAIRSQIALGTQSRRVSVVSGGGSGHEPMACGYVGDGMLAAGVAGSIFVSPSIPAVSAMLNAVVSSSTGILVVVMNYQGDRLNFSMAVDDFKTRHPHVPVHIMFVADDIALPHVEEKRGIAGSVFVLKVAAAAADEGRPLEEVAAIAHVAANSLVTLGVALEPCTIPGHAINVDRLAAHEIELGMGIHGEAGAEVQNLSEISASTLTKDIITTICTRLEAALLEKIQPNQNYTSLAILVNNLGAVSQAEMLIVRKCVADFLYRPHGNVLNGKQYRIHMFSGSYMTSLEMNGISVSCMLLSSEKYQMEDLLLASTACTAWIPSFPLCEPAKRPTSTEYAPEQEKTFSGVEQDPTGLGSSGSGLCDQTEKNIITITEALLGYSNRLGELDRRTGDGDLGDTVRRACEEIRRAVLAGDYGSAGGNGKDLFWQLSESTSATMGGSSGVLTSVFLRAMSRRLGSGEGGSGESWRDGVVAGTAAVMERGGATVGDRTLVDALKPATDVLARMGSLEEAAVAAGNGCESTKGMRAKFGRSVHVRDEQLDVEDPGAAAICVIFDALVKAKI